LQCRNNDRDIINVLNQITHKPTHYCVLAERNVLKILEGDCATPVGAIANLDGENINLEAELFSIDGKQRFYHRASRNINSAAELGRGVGEILKKESNNSYKR
jgi:hydroxymethylbilane synthase